MGSSEVNGAIAETLRSDAEYFWYYNNGVTIIAEDLKRQVIGGSDRTVGVFDCKNVTIVNGAQTVGTIGRNLRDCPLISQSIRLTTSYSSLAW